MRLAWTTAEHTTIVSSRPCFQVCNRARCCSEIVDLTPTGSEQLLDNGLLGKHSAEAEPERIDLRQPTSLLRPQSGREVLQQSAAVSQLAMRSLPPITLPSSSLHPSDFGCALINPHPTYFPPREVGPETLVRFCTGYLADLVEPHLITQGKGKYPRARRFAVRGRGAQRLRSRTHWRAQRSPARRSW